MAHVDFSAIINDFLTAELGEEVRDSLVAIAEALQTAINTQLTTVTTDLDSTDANAALRVKTLKDLFALVPYYQETINPVPPDTASLSYRDNSIRMLNITTENKGYFDALPADATGFSFLISLKGATSAYVAQMLISPLVGIWTRRWGQSTGTWSSWRGGVDKTLSVSSAAADALVVGNRFAEVDAAFGNTLKNYGIMKGGDVNLVMDNSIRAINLGSYTFQNLPSGASGVMYLITIGFGTGNLTGWQVLYGSTGRMWQRRYASNSWNEWYSLDDRIDLRVSKTLQYIDTTGVYITNSNKGEYFTDFNSAPINTVYRIAANAQLDNSPFGDGMSSAAGIYDGTYRDVAGYADGTLLTYGVGTEYVHQIFISGKVSGASSGRKPPDNATLFYRTKYNDASPKWGTWHAVSDWRTPTATNIAIRRKFIGRWLDGTGKATNTKTATLNEQYMSDYLAPYLDGDGVPVPFDEGGYAANPNYVPSNKFFNDFNNAPFNSIYQIDLDCIAEIMANNPEPGRSSVLVTTGFSWSGMQHGKIQLCVGVDSSSTFAYVRYGYIQSASQGIYIWTNWLHLADADELATLKARVETLERQVANLGG